MFRVVVVFLLLAASSRSFVECKVEANPSFMIAAGVSAASEHCIVASGASVSLGSCAKAVAVGDGNDIWSFSNGQIVSTVSSKCLTLLGGDATDGGHVGLVDCDSATKSAGSQWEVTGSGQLKLGTDGDYCLSQSGMTPGLVNIASNAGVAASSTADNIAHGAAAAVDSNEASFWASKLGDTTEPVTFTLDLGTAASISSVSIGWEFPAQAFSISTSVDGEHFAEAFATDSNVLASTTASLGGVVASMLRITMHRPHPTHGSFEGHSLYGIKSLATYSPGMNVIVEKCSKAANSGDARDKYFQIRVGEFDAYAAKALASELPALEAAMASVSAIISELAEALPQMSTCKGRSIAWPKLLAKRSVLAVGVGDLADAEHVGALIAEARATIMAARALLK